MSVSVLLLQLLEISVPADTLLDCKIACDALLSIFRGISRSDNAPHHHPPYLVWSSEVNSVVAAVVAVVQVDTCGECNEASFGKTNGSSIDHLLIDALETVL